MESINSTPPYDGHVQAKVCAKCGQEKPITEFSKFVKGRYGVQSYCKECSRAAVRENKLKRKIAGNMAVPNSNPALADKSPRELQCEMRILANELRARGFNCDVKLTYVNEIII